MFINSSAFVKSKVFVYSFIEEIFADIIIYKKDLHKQMCTSTIPTCFGGPLNHLTYAKLIGFKEAEWSEKLK